MDTKQTQKALQQFLDTWSPVVAAVPKVIDALSELQRIESAVVMAKKDLATLNQQYTDAEEAQAKAEKAWAERLDGLVSEISKASTQVGDAQAKAKAEVAAINNKTAAAIKKAEAKLQEVLDKAAQEETFAAERIAATQQAQAEAIKQYEDMTAEAEAKYKAVVKKLDTLKASL